MTWDPFEPYDHRKHVDLLLHMQTFGESEHLSVEERLARYGSPELRRNELTLAAWREHRVTKGAWSDALEAEWQEQGTIEGRAS